MACQCRTARVVIARPAPHYRRVRNVRVQYGCRLRRAVFCLDVLVVCVVGYPGDSRVSVAVPRNRGGGNPWGECCDPAEVVLVQWTNVMCMVLTHGCVCIAQVMAGVAMRGLSGWVV